MSALDDNLLLEDVRIIFRNFRGESRPPFNGEGERNFCVILDAQQADKLKRLGMNVKETKVREEGDEPEYFIKVKVEYGKGRPPRIISVTSSGRTELGADEVFFLDYADLRKVDLTINPYNYTMAGGQSGVSAYLRTGIFFVDEDALEQKYAEYLNENPTNLLSTIANEETVDA